IRSPRTTTRPMLSPPSSTATVDTAVTGLATSLNLRATAHLNDRRLQMPQPKRWYSMQASTAGGQAVAEIRIYDEIGFWGMNAKDFMAELDEVSGAASRILVSINSPGGDVFDAFAIYNALRRHDLPVTARVDGVAASAASLI